MVICTLLRSLSKTLFWARKGSTPKSVTPNCMLTVFAILTQRFAARKARQLFFSFICFQTCQEIKKKHLKIKKKLFCS